MDEQNSRRKYNGWTNYETWVVRLWLDNEEPSYRYWAEQARRWHGREGAAGRLAEQLKDELSAGSPVDEPTVYGDLMNAALAEVDWLEIAESYLDEVDDGGAAGEGDDGPCGPRGTAAAGDADEDGGVEAGPRPAKDVLPADVAEALDKLLRYVWRDEFENFIADEPGPDEEHIFRHIAVVDGWFDGHEATAEELVAEFGSDDDVREWARARVRSFRGD